MQPAAHHLHLRRKVYHMLGGEGRHTPLVRVMDLALLTLICANCISSILETVESLSVMHSRFFHEFDLISVGIFSVEYVLRVWTAVEKDEFRDPLWGRLRYMVTPMALVDLVAVLPFYLGFFVQIDLREFRVLRLLRLFKLTRYSSAMTIMMAVIRQELHAISTMLVMFAITLVSISSLMFLIEHPVQPQLFTDIPSSMWWGVVTMTTLGYGDMVPITPWGRVLGGFTALLGVGMIAFPAGVLASGFTEQLRLRREDYERKADGLLEKKMGKITTTDRRRLEEARLALHLTHQEAAHILEHARMGKPLSCPHCGLPIVPERQEEI